VIVYGVARHPRGGCLIESEVERSGVSKKGKEVNYHNCNVITSNTILMGKKWLESGATTTAILPPSPRNFILIIKFCFSNPHPPLKEINLLLRAK
jgi:hypothetical protein